MKKLLLAVITAALIAPLAGQTPQEAVNTMENQSGVGVRSLAMGGAMTAAADDYSAIFYNPACLTLLRRTEISGSMYHLRFRNEAAYSGTAVTEEDRFNQFESAGLAYRFPTSRGSLVMAFGYNRFKDLNDFTWFTGFSAAGNGLEFELEDLDGSTYVYPYDQEVQRTQDIRQHGYLGAWSVGGGLALSPGFSLGVTFSAYSGRSEYDFRFYQDDVDDLYYQYPANYDSYELYQFINSRYSGGLMRVGGLFHLSGNLRLGVSVDLPSVLHVYEDYAADDVLYFDDGSESAFDLGSGEWEYLVKYPAKISGGAALDTRMLLLSAAWEHRDWTQTRFDVPSEYEATGDYADLLFENASFRDQFRAVTAWSAGAELRLPGTGLKLRGGYRSVPSPLYDADESLDREYISAGIGYDLDSSTSIHVTGIRGTWNRFTEDSYTPGGTSEQIKTQRIMAGITWRL